MSALNLSTVLTPGKQIEALTKTFHAIDQLLLQWQSTPAVWQQLLQQVFGRSAPFDLSAISLEILDSQTMEGLRGAYTASDPKGEERIYLNAGWLKTATAPELEAVLLEEIGHAIDHRLNSDRDTSGDEGAIFSALIQNRRINPSEFNQNDHSELLISGRKITIEASSITTPTPVASITDGAGGFDELDNAYSVTTVVIGGSTYALVASQGDDGLQIVDISTPAAPTAVASITDGAGGFDELADAVSVTTVVIGSSTYALVASLIDDGLQIVDISTPAAPTAVASITDGAGGFDELDGAYGVTTVVIGGSTYALAASFKDSGLQIVDISTPAAPRAVASITDGVGGFDELDGAHSVTTVVIGGSTYALVASLTDDGLQIVDISTPAAPTAVASITDGVGGFDELDGALSVTTVVIGSSTYALVASLTDDGLQIVDISTPAAPTAVASITDGAGGFDELDGAYGVTTVVIGGSTYALVASLADDALQIVDISTPAAPTAVVSITDGVGGFDELYGAQSVTTAVIGGSTYALVASRLDSGLQIVNIDTAPTLTSATYNASSTTLVVTSSNLVAKSGALNDIVVSRLTITGEGGNSYTLTSADVEIDSETQFTLTLNAVDSLQIAGLLNKNGTSSAGGSTYNIAASSGWNPGAGSSPADATGNAITISNLVNVAPSGTNKTITINEDRFHTYAASDFGFSDSNGDALSAVIISTLPAAGGLKLDGSGVTANDSIPVADINASMLIFTPVSNGNGSGYTSFTFQVKDDGGTANAGVDTDPSANTITIDVNAVNDAPTGSVTISGTATQGQTFTAANTLADADGLGTIAYGWKRAGAAISGATSSTYQLVQADVGSEISVTASYTDGEGKAESVSASATSAVKALPVFVPPSSPEENQQVDEPPQFTEFDDVAIGRKNFTYRMLGGNDVLEVLGGDNNFANGNQGDDRFVLRAGQKGQYLGGKGVDTFEVFGGIDAYANGQKGADQIILRGGLGQYLGGDDGDRIEVLAAVSGSWVNGNRGEDTIIGSVAGVTYRGGADADLMLVSQGDVYGDKGADTFRGVKGEGYAVIQDYTVGVDVVDLEMEGRWSRLDSGLMFTDDSGDQIMLLLRVNDLDQVTLI